VRLVRRRQHGQHAGRAGRQAAHDGVAHRQRLAVGLQEHLRRGRGGRGLAAVVGLHLTTIPVQQEGTAGDAAGLRFHQAQHRLHGDGGIDGGTASAQRLQAGLCGQRVGSGDGETLGRRGERGRLGGARGRSFGLLDRLGQRKGRGQQRGDPERLERHAAILGSRPWPCQK